MNQNLFSVKSNVISNNSTLFEKGNVSDISSQPS